MGSALWLLPLCSWAGFTTTPFEGTLGKVSWQSEWHAQDQGIKLDFTVKNNGDGKAEIVFDFPIEPIQFKKTFVCPNGINKFSVTFPAVNSGNKYQIDSSVSVGVQTLQSPLFLIGDKVNPLLVRTSKMVKPNYRFGACSHLNFCIKQEKGWGDGWWHYQELIDSMRGCNIFITRTDLGEPVKDTKTGKYKLVDEMVKRVNYAVDHGVEVIGIIPLNSKDSLEESVKMFADVAQGYPQLKYLEVGNEPYNFGDWKKNYGGEWNSWNEAGGVPAPWVAAVLKYSNAIADAVKKVRPDMTIIGMDTLPCNTLRAINVGISPAMAGIALHPYGYSFPPEYLPWGEPFVGRDKISTGDAQCSIYGLGQKFADTFAKHGMKQKLWFTEWGYPTFSMHPGKAPNPMYVPHTEEAQAVYILRRQLEYLRYGDLLGGSMLYSYMDDAHSDMQDWETYEPEAGFGILRSDRTKKKAWYVMQRFNALLAHAQLSKDVNIQALNCNMDPIMKKEKNICWGNEKANFLGKSGVRNLILTIPNGKDSELAIALWSERRYDAEFAASGTNLRFTGKIAKTDKPFVIVDLVTGRSFDAKWKKNGEQYEIENIAVGKNPLLLLLGPVVQ